MNIDKIISIIVKSGVVEVIPEDICENTRLQEDLMIDSFKMLVLAAELEKQLLIRLDLYSLAGVKTIGELCDACIPK